MINLEKKRTSLKPEIEIVENEKQEFKLIDTYLRKPGLALFSYNIETDDLQKVEIDRSKTCSISMIHGEVEVKPSYKEKVVVDPKLEYFESLNFNSALRRVQRFKAGEIGRLFNLRVPNNLKNISFF